VLEVCRPLLIGDRAHLLEAARRPSGVSAPPPPGADPAAWPEVSRSPFGWGSRQGDDVAIEPWAEGAAFYDLADRPVAEDPPGPTAAGGRSSVMYIKQAVALVRTGVATGIATAPISKAALALAGVRYPGHTELLADLCGCESDQVAMMFMTPDLKVGLLTVHLPLAQAIASLSVDAVRARLRLLHAEHRRWFGKTPRIAVAALNPHAGESGMFGREEAEILAPAAEAARAEGIEVSGPHPADTVCVRAARGEFDLVLALYHDQATIAIKARSFGEAVNVTLGLPFIRTSVDHGTAWDIAGKGVAGHGSLVEAIRLAARLSDRPR
jgi:4-hydroxythreonine-4-phosphate dehydrogenase